MAKTDLRFLSLRAPAWPARTAFHLGEQEPACLVLALESGRVREVPLDRSQLVAIIGQAAKALESLDRAGQ